MRVVIVAPYYPFPPSIGGVETIVREVSLELSKRGHEVYIITTPFDVTTNQRVTEYGIEKKDNIVIYKLKTAKVKVGYAQIMYGIKDTIVKIQPDIVHSHNLHPHLFQLARWKEQFKYKLVAELHHPGVTIFKPIQYVMLPLAINYLKRIQHKIDMFIAHSLSEKKWMTDLGFTKEKIEIVRLPSVDKKFFDYKLLSKNKERPEYILFFGRITPIKGVHMLIKAFKFVRKLNPQVKLVLAGPQDKKYVEYLIKLIDEMKLQNHVIFLGPVYGNKKIELIKSAKILILPSFKEYTPSVLLEAMALGTPVIASRVGAIPEYIINKVNGVLVTPGDEEELGKAINELLFDEKALQIMSEKAQKVAKKYTIDSAVDLLLNIYQDLLLSNI